MRDAPRLRSLILPDLPMLLSWRNHPSVRSVMFSQHEIAAEEHREWFLRASDDACRRLLIAEDADGPFGFVQFAAVGKGAISDWGFYIRPDAVKGSGTILCRTALEYAFDVLALHKVCGQAITTNAASVGIHRKLGFVEEGVLRDQKLVNGSYLSLVCFGLLKSEWVRKAHSRNSQ